METKNGVRDAVSCEGDIQYDERYSHNDARKYSLVSLLSVSPTSQTPFQLVIITSGGGATNTVQHA